MRANAAVAREWKARCGVAAIVTILAAATVAAAWPWTIETVQVGTGPGGVGFYNALAIDPTTSAPTIAYSDNDRDDVLLARWTGTSWTREVVDGGRNVATGIDLAYDAMNRPAISYGWGALSLAEWNGSRWVITVVDTKNARNDTTSLVYYNGQPAISYRVVSGKSTTLRLARRTGSTWSIETVDTAGAGRYSSLAFDGAGNPAIAYSADPDGDGTLSALRIARKLNGAWAIQQPEVGAGAGVDAKLAFVPNSATPVVVHRPHTGVRYLWWNGSGWVGEAVGEGSNVSLAIDPITQEPLVAYAAPLYGPNLTLARRTVSGWTFDTVVTEDSGYVIHPQMAFGPLLAQPHLSYSVATSGTGETRTLKFARAAQ